MSDLLTAGNATPATRMAVSLLRYANREAVAQALTQDGYSVSRATVNRWAKGAEMPEIAARMIAELFGHTDTTKSAPAWAEALADETAKKVIGALAPADLLEAAGVLIARLEGLRLPPDGSPPSPGAAAGRGGAVPPVREAG